NQQPSIVLGNLLALGILTFDPATGQFSVNPCARLIFAQQAGDIASADSVQSVKDALVSAGLTPTEIAALVFTQLVTYDSVTDTFPVDLSAATPPSPSDLLHLASMISSEIAAVAGC